MQIDWFTVVAQIVNFLILVYLLKRFLYGPIVSAMDRREQRVTDRLREARESQDAAEERAAELQREQDELDEKRQALLDEARDEAEEHRGQLLDEIRGEVEEIRERWRREIEREQESFVRELREQAAGWIAAAARRALAELADARLEERIVGVFEERLRKLPDEDRDALVEAVQERDEPLRVVTTFELPEERREALRELFMEQVGEQVELRFAESADLVCGIELRTPGNAIAFSLDAFVKDLGERLEEALDRASGRDPETGTDRGANEKGPDEERETGEEEAREGAQESERAQEKEPRA
jgi:F-type H+-transporting ATPase subunit b